MIEVTKASQSVKEVYALVSCLVDGGTPEEIEEIGRQLSEAGKRAMRDDGVGFEALMQALYGP